MECAGMRASTSLNQANGSMPDRLQEAMKLRNTAAVLPPLSLPKNVQLPRPSAISRLARSVAPLSITNSPSSRKRVSASRWTLWQNLRLQLQQILVELADQPRRYSLAQCQPLLRRQRQRLGSAPLLHTGVRSGAAPVPCVARRIPTP